MTRSPSASLAEKRKSSRRTQQETVCMLNETPTLVFPVWEMSPHGFSFLVEKTGTTFFPGSIFQNVTLRTADGLELIRSTNARLVHVSDFDETTFRVGIRYGQVKYDRTFWGRIRASRHQSDSSAPIMCSCTSPAQPTTTTVSGTMIDYTANAIKVQFDQPVSFPQGESVHIHASVYGHEVFDQLFTLIRSDDPTTAIFGITGTPLNIDDIRDALMVSHSSRLVTEGLDSLQDLTQIPSSLKALVADWETYLGRLKYILDTEEKKQLYTTPQAQLTLIHHFENRVITDMNAYVERLNTIIESDSAYSFEHFQKYLSEHLGSYLLLSPQVVRMKDKIHGYHGDFETIGHYFGDHYEGTTLFGRIMNKWVSACDTVQGHINRVAFILDLLKKEYRAATTMPFKVLTLGSGPAAEIIDFVKNMTDDDPEIHFTLLDLDAVGLVTFADRIQYYQRHNAFFNYLNADIMQVLKNNTLPETAQQYDFTYCAGMLDYFVDKRCRNIVNILYNATKPGGIFLYTNVHVSNHFRHMMALATDWRLFHRTTEQIQNLAPETIPTTTFVDATGTNVIVYGRKNQ